MTHSDYYNDKTAAYQVSGGRLQAILDVLPPEPVRILDIGCGGGHLARELVAEGYTVTGVDISSRALNDAMPSLEEGHCFDIANEQWPAGLLAKRFDVIVASEIIEHVFEPIPLLSRLKGLLAQDGQLIITTPNVLFWKNRLKMLVGSFEYEKTGIMDFGHIRLFTIATARKVFVDAGLRIEKENHFFPNLYQRGLNWLGRTAPGLFAYHMVFSLKSTHE